MITSRPTDTSSTSTKDLPYMTSHAASTPAPTRLDLLESETTMGWIDGMAIGFHGFADENEAAHAAWLSYRTMSRRFAHAGGQRPVPVSSEPLSLVRSGDAELILAAGRPIATLVRPGADSRSGPEAFGFELQMPLPTDELTVRSTARLLYRTLRRSGIRWAIWESVAEQPAGRAPSSAGESLPEPGADASDFTRELSRHGASRAHAARVRDDSTGMMGALLVILAMIVIVVLPAITASVVVPVLGGAAGLFALAALAGLVHLVATDVRDSTRNRPRPSRATSHGSSALRSPREVAA